MTTISSGITKIIQSGNISQNVYSEKLEIAYGVDRAFLFGAAISMQSIALYNPSVALNFHIFTDYIDNDYIKRINEFTQKNVNIIVSIYLVSDELAKSFPSAKQWSYATFFRFVAFQYLSETCEKLLYIDADVICKGKLTGLLDIDLTTDKFAAVIKDVPFMQDKPAKRLNLPGLPGNYFNAGVMFLKLAEWKKRDLMSLAIKMLADDPLHLKYKCLDQDILNILLFEHCLFISNDYDCFYGVDYELENENNYDYEKVITKDTKLIHYVGVTKPWHDWVDYPCQKYFFDAYHSSCWSDIPLLTAVGEKQFMMKSLHHWKNRFYFSSIMSFAKYRVMKSLRKCNGN
ncbi:glycosyltransferase [Hafnia alvei]|uniref:glycosyltransferase family 8 protein n=1 Tax=Hafnia alvei TaxID=569 RepID=UPI000B6F4686|nr:glycosyltransferase [Hafnia alvei]MBI0276262.1 glycosyltransferase [Hafnia alvei]MCE9871424.1 glycosyltransferase [Hafnia alvei]PNK97164.1 UDP-galactose--(galactosyl) LPS alpha1,2-galactosyltransferase [Hafnia alvei]